MFAFLMIIVLLFIFLGTGPHWIALPMLIVGFVFVTAWVIVFKMLIGFGRWLMGMPPPSARRVANPPRPFRPAIQPAPFGRTCADPRCCRVNVAGARYCAQCGRELTSANIPINRDASRWGLSA